MRKKKMKNKIFYHREKIFPLNDVVVRDDVYNIIDWVLIEEDVSEKK